MIWSRMLNNVKPNTNYVLTFNAANLTGGSTSLAFSAYIDCNRVGNDITSNFTSKCQWAEYSIDELREPDLIQVVDWKYQHSNRVQ